MKSKLDPKPDSCKYPENRRGTRTHRKFAQHCGIGRLDGTSMVVAMASSKQYAKALHHMEMGLSPHMVQGRIIRAIMRDMNDYYNHVPAWKWSS